MARFARRKAPSSNKCTSALGSYDMKVDSGATKEYGEVNGSSNNESRTADDSLRMIPEDCLHVYFPLNSITVKTL